MRSSFARLAPFVRTVSIVAFGAVTALAQSRPNFSGTWREVQPSSPGYSYIETIHHQEPSLKVAIETQSTGGRLGSALYMDRTYIVGGKKDVQTSDDGIVRTVAVAWDGNTLVFLRTEQEGANTTTTREVWSLSEDGRTLTRVRHITNWRGARDETSVLHKP